MLLEAAHFEPTGVLLTGKRHGIRTEAVARFERGVDPELPPIASARATSLIATMAGGVPVGALVDEYPNPARPVTISLAVREVERLLGVRLFALEIGGLLGRLGFEVTGDDPLVVTVPTFRPDVTRPADLVEEVARLHGLDNIAATLPHGPGAGVPDFERRRRQVRAAMVGAGTSRSTASTSSGREAIDRLRFQDDDPRAHPLQVHNPLSDELAWLRPTLLPGILDGLRVNVTRHNSDAALFEMGSVFLPAPEAPLPEQPLHLGFGAIGNLPGRSWVERGSRDALDAVGLVTMLADATGLALEVVQSTEPGFHPGRCSTVMLAGQRIGVIGEIHPDIAAAWGLTGRVAAGELSLSALGSSPGRKVVVPSAFPPVVFDLAFDLAARTPVGKVLTAIRQAAGSTLEDAVVFDVFSGPPLASNRMSVAVRLTFRHPERTMVDAEMVPVRTAIATRVRDEFGGMLRGG